MNPKDRQKIVKEVNFRKVGDYLIGEEQINLAITLTEQKTKDEIIGKIDMKIKEHEEQLKNTKETGIKLNMENRILGLKDLKQSVK